MEASGLSKTRTRSFAVIAGIAMPGLGQIYNGDLLRGICFFAIFMMIPRAGLKATTLLPDRLLLAGTIVTILLTVAIYLAAVVDSFIKAESVRNAPKPWQRWYFYITIWMAGSLFIGSSAFNYIPRHIVQFCYVPTGSMEPAVLPGDYVIIDKSAPRRLSPHRGDIVLFTYPDDRSLLYMKRIAGLPGDTVVIDSVHPPVVVPHGQVYLLGDNREHARDSRHFGTVSLQDLQGKARQVYFSVGKNGIRWKRIGSVL